MIVSRDDNDTIWRIEWCESLFCNVKVDFDDIFVQPDALRHGDIGRYLAVPVRRVFGFVFAYTQVTHWFT